MPNTGPKSCRVHGVVGGKGDKGGDCGEEEEQHRKQCHGYRCFFNKYNEQKINSTLAMTVRAMFGPNTMDPKDQIQKH